MRTVSLLFVLCFTGALFAQDAPPPIVLPTGDSGLSTTAWVAIITAIGTQLALIVGQILNYFKSREAVAHSKEASVAASSAEAHAENASVDAKAANHASIENRGMIMAMNRPQGDGFPPKVL